MAVISILGAILMVSSILANDIPLTKLVSPISYQLDLYLKPELFTSQGTEFSGKHITFNNTVITNYTQDHLTDILFISLNTKLTAGAIYDIILEYTGYIDPNGITGLNKKIYSLRNGYKQYLIATKVASTHARTVFPCFDEPGLTATFNVSITFPAVLNVIFNTEELGRVPDNDTRLTTVAFKTTPKMSTHLLAFIVSNLTCTTGTVVSNSVVLRVCSRDDYAEKRNFALEMVSKLLLSYNNFTNYNYSHAIEKLDIVALPESSAESLLIMPRDSELISNKNVAIRNVHPGVTANWGLIIHRENHILHNYTETPTHKQIVVLAISHALAHQWFGDLVTFNSWSEIFINKGLAAYFQFHITNEVKPIWETEKQFIVDSLHETLVHDALNNIHPLYYQDDIDTEFIESSYSELSYNKGGVIMRMVQHVIGLENFRKGIQDYINMYKFISANIDALWRVLSQTIDNSTCKMPASLSTVMENWIMDSGYPLLNVTLTDGRITITQSKFVYHPQHLKNPQTRWYVPISYTTSEEVNKFEKTTPDVWLTPHDVNITFPYPTNSTWIILNNQQTGYYRVTYDKTLLRGITDALRKHDFDGISEINRAHLVDDFFNLARAGMLPYSELFKHISFLKNDTSYYPWKAAAEGFRLILRRVGYDSLVGQKIVKDILDMIPNLYRSVPISIVPEDDPIYILKQQLALDWACRLNYEPCVSDVGELYRKYDYENIQPKASLRYVVYCNAVRRSKKIYDWLFVYNSLDWETEPSEQQAVLSAMACETNLDYLKDYLEESLEHSSMLFTFIEVMNIFIETENNPEAVKAAFEILIDNQDRIIRKYQPTGLLEYMFVGIAERLNGTEIEKLKKLVKEGRLKKGFMEYGPKALQAAEKNIIWSEALGSKLILCHPENNSKLILKKLVKEERLEKEFMEYGSKALQAAEKNIIWSEALRNELGVHYQEINPKIIIVILSAVLAFIGYISCFVGVAVCRRYNQQIGRVFSQFSRRRMNRIAPENIEMEEQPEQVSEVASMENIETEEHVSVVASTSFDEIMIIRH